MLRRGRFRVVLLLVACLLGLVLGCSRAPSRVVIISDLHPHPSAFEQLDSLTRHVIELRPAFAVTLGDMGGDEVPGGGEKEIDAIRKCFNRMRAAGIEIYPTMGNHDVNPRVQDIKVDWLLAQTPLPLNVLFDAAARSPAWRAFESKGPYDYSFNRGGIHFAIVDSNVMPPKPDWTPERLATERPRWEAHRQWMKDDLCRQTGNPRRLPTLVFLHHPEYMTGDRGLDSRPLYRVMETCREQQTVKAVFAGHWHMGANFPVEKNLGIQVYATQASVHPTARPVQFIVAEVSREGLTLQARDSVTGTPSVGPVRYYPIPGTFTDLRH